MKSTEEIIRQEPVYLHDWAESKKFGIIADFEGIYISPTEYNAIEPPYSNIELWNEDKARMKAALEKWEPINILFASYSYENYSGEAWVLFEQDGKLYEVNGSHCSCYGLEGQWSPEDVNLSELEHRLEEGTFGTDGWSGNVFKTELMQFLGIGN